MALLTGQQSTDPQFQVARKHLFWAAPLLLLVCAILAGLLALPAFVAAPAHRAMVENFASRLTGREVHISGDLSLSYLPRPEIIASGITISGPGHEVITASALSLDISLTSLLHGQFAVQTLRLDAPVISFPWPIPGGINDIAPPPWLTTLHARIDNGQIHIGAMDFTGVDADLLTGAGGSVRVSGTGTLTGQPVALSLSIGQTASLGGTNLSAHASFGGLTATLNGTLDTASLLKGQLTLRMPDGMTGQAQIMLDGTMLRASELNFQQGSTHLAGNARLTFGPTSLNAALVTQNLDLDRLHALAPFWSPTLPTRVDLTAFNTIIAGYNFPSLQTVFTADANGYSLSALTLSMDGSTTLKGNVKRAHDGALSGHLTLVSPDFKALLKNFGLPSNADWNTAVLRAELTGTENTPQFTDLSGALGRDQVTGQIFFSPRHAAFQLDFDHLGLFPLAQALQQLPLGNTFTADGELTAAQAQAGPVKLDNLFIDVDFDNGLNIRRATANLYGGMAVASMTLDDHFAPIAAHMFINLPAAAPLVTAILPQLKLPRALLAQPLNLVAAAAGPPGALAATSVIRLGTFDLTVAPLINLTKSSASGALSIRNPDAIAALKMLGLTQGCSRMSPLPGYPFQSINQPCSARDIALGLAFPGPGSLSLRAAFTAAPGAYGLTDFILSVGSLNASGRLKLQQQHLTGQINATVLALPALPANATIPVNMPISGQISMSAGQVLYAGSDILGPTSGIFTLSPHEIDLSALKASLGDGVVSGHAELKLPPDSMPALSATLAAEGIDASTLTLAKSFPLQLGKGQISATATLNATGYTTKTWAATLGGNISLTAKNGELDGLSLPNIVTALNTTPPADIAAWMAKGSTDFTSLAITATISQGNCTLTQAELTSPAGSLSAVGGVDLFDESLALRLEAHPAVHPALTLTSRLIGSWAHPNRIVDVSAALGWHATPSAP